MAGPTDREPQYVVLRVRDSISFRMTFVDLETAEAFYKVAVKMNYWDYVELSHLDKVIHYYLSR